MKKFVLIFLAVMLAFSAHAEDTDCSALSDEELLNLLLEISEEIDARGLEAAQIKDGRYTAGTDIKSGKGEISSSDKGIGMTSIKIYESKSETKDIFSYSIKGKGTCYISLEKGMVLELASIGSHKCYIKEVENFFAPGKANLLKPPPETQRWFSFCQKSARNEPCYGNAGLV